MRRLEFLIALINVKSNLKKDERFPEKVSMIWRDLLCCLTTSSSPSPLLPTNSIDSDVKTHSHCVFCHVTPERFDIVTETSDYIVFKDRSPAALHHLLAIPRSHTANIKSVRGKEGALLGAYGKHNLSMSSH